MADIVTLEDAMKALGLEPDQLFDYRVDGDSVTLVTLKDKSTEIVWSPGAEATTRPVFIAEAVPDVASPTKKKASKKKG